MTLRWDPVAVVAAVEQEEREIVFDQFTHDDAWDLGTLVAGVGRARELPIAVAVDLRGQRVFQAGLPGSSLENDSWIDRKVRAVRDFNESTFLLGRRVEARGEKPDEVFDTTLYAAHGGGFPLRVRSVDSKTSELVGVLVISGLPQEDDHALAVECLRMFVTSRLENRP